MKRNYTSKGKCRPHRWAPFFTPAGAPMRKCVECLRIEAAPSGPNLNKFFRKGI